MKRTKQYHKMLLNQSIKSPLSFMAQFVASKYYEIISVISMKLHVTIESDGDNMKTV